MLLTTFISPEYLVGTFGLLGIIFIIFAETGLLFGFFFPGDSLLFLAGAYAATNKPGLPHLPLIPLLIGVTLAAVLGGQTGYYIGRFLGPRLFENKQSKVLKSHYIQRTREVLERYGETKAVLLARVIPIVRTFISPVVGAIGMPLRSFAVANILGGAVWALCITLLGYALGSSINIDKYILPITGVVILLSVIPVVLEYRKHRLHQ